MKKDRYYYNTHSLRYEKIEDTVGSRLMKVFSFVSAAILFGFVIVVLAYTLLDSPKEKLQKAEIHKLREQYMFVDKQMGEMSKVLDGLQYRDNNIYRTIFEAQPIPPEVWGAGAGGVNKYAELENYENGQLMSSVARKLDKIRNQLYIQSKSYDDVTEMVKNKTDMLASIPSIQPISNKDLTRMASGYGMRLDPIYKIPKMHRGMDFTASTGTEVYATGDGVVRLVKFSAGGLGYGNQIVIDHGYGYMTRYAHLSGFKVRKGKRVKRGDVIGFVGNTGKSVGPHLHYEVLKDDRHVNPIYFYYNDLNTEQYEKLVAISSSQQQPLD